MGDWCEIKLGDLFVVKAGGDLQENFFSLSQSETTPYPIYSNSLNNNGLYGYTSNPRYPMNCVTITGRGELGHAEYRETPFDAIVRLLVLIPKNEVDCKFITYYINHQVKFAIESTGVPQLPAPRIKKLKINIPKNVSEQTAIASILSKVDEAIEATLNSIKAAEKLKKALMQNLLSGKLKPDGTWRTEDEYYMDEKFGKVPVGWEITKIKKIVKLKNGKGNTTSNLKEKPIDDYEIPVYGGNGITGYYNIPLLSESTLIIGRVGEYCGNVFKTPKLSWVTDNAMLVDKFLIEDYSLDFFKYKFSTLNFKNFSDSTGQPKITQGGIGAIYFIYPKLKNDQVDIAIKISKVNNISVNKQSKIQALHRLKKSLMQNLLTGKIRVDVEKVTKLLSTKKIN